MSAAQQSPHFTGRQRQVVELIAAGCSNAEIGEILGLSARTAKAHSDVLRRKLGVPLRRHIPAAYRMLTGEDPLIGAPGIRKGGGR
jgi:ATP/maltotriose-dependent transcriptional regulator MalT